jgi:hypothetical protein
MCWWVGASDAGWCAWDGKVAANDELISSTVLTSATSGRSGRSPAASRRSGTSGTRRSDQPGGRRIRENTSLPLNDDSVDLVITNSVPIDTVSLGQPGVQSSEIRRILAPGGQWIHDGQVRYTKP